MATIKVAHHRVGQHRHRPDDQGRCGISEVARDGRDGRHRPGLRRPGAGQRAGRADHRRGRRRAGRACASSTTSRSSSTPPRPAPTAHNDAVLRAARQAGDRPHAGRDRPVRRARRSTCDEHLDAPNVNMVTCGGQATIPIVAAVSRVAAGALRRDRRLDRLASRPGPGTRANIDEFTETTAQAIEVGRRRRARQGDHHPQPGRAAADHARHGLLPRSTVAEPDAGDRARRSTRWSPTSQRYVPGYRLKQEVQFDRIDDRPAAATSRRWTGKFTGLKVSVFLEVEGAGALPAAPTPATSTS